MERKRIRGQTFYARSGIERTLIDALDRPQLCVRPELWVRAWERALREGGLDLPLLLELARRRSRAVCARAALLLREAGRPREARLSRSPAHRPGALRQLRTPRQGFGPVTETPGCC